jgi:hypothetical protein
MNHRTLARLLAAGRIVVGVALLAAPRRAGQVLIGTAAASPSVAVITRIAGVRDIALGAGTLAALAEGRARRWLRWGAVCDLVDGCAAARAGADAPWITRRVVPIAAMAAGVLGSQLGERLD